MKYLKKFNEELGNNTLDSLKKEDIVDNLYDLSYELKDNGFDLNIEEYYYQPGHRQFIICRIVPGEKDLVDDNIIETADRIIDYMQINSYGLGSNNWVYNGAGKLRVKRKISSSWYLISLKELNDFIGFDFEKIELVFDPII